MSPSPYSHTDTFTSAVRNGRRPTKDRVKPIFTSYYVLTGTQEERESYEYIGRRHGRNQNPNRYTGLISLRVIDRNICGCTLFIDMILYMPIESPPRADFKSANFFWDGASPKPEIFEKFSKLYILRYAISGL